MCFKSFAAQIEVEFSSNTNPVRPVSPAYFGEKTELFENALLNRGIWKRLLSAGFRVDRKHFESGGAFRNDGVTIVLWFPLWSFFRHKSKMTGDCCVFLNYCCVVWTEKIWCVCRVKTPLKTMYNPNEILILSLRTVLEETWREVIQLFGLGLSLWR